LAETEKGSADGVSQDAELKLLTKAAKQRKESADVFASQGRPIWLKKNFRTKCN
jgi:uncharacterized protein